jgi:hypothetical protein
LRCDWLETELLKLLFEDAVCKEELLAFFLRVGGLEAEGGAATEALGSGPLDATEVDARGIWRESALPTRIETG